MAQARSNEEMEAVRDKASDQIEEYGTKWPGMSYEQGVADALEWAMGWNDTDPMDEE